MFSSRLTRPSASTLVVVAVAVVALVLPLLLSDLTFFVKMVLACAIVTGLSLFMGYAGQASLGHGAFVAVGALTVAVMTVRFGMPPLIALVIAPLVSALFALAIGAPLLRLRGHYLAFGTLAVLLVVQALMSTIPLLGGGIGIFGIPPLGIGPLVITGQLPYAYVALGVLALVIVVSHNLIHSRFGRGVRALAGSESAASASGVPVLRSKVSVFAVSAAFAGLAGGVSAFFTPYVSQDSFPPLESFTYVIMAVIGGLGSLWGGVVGAVAISVLLQVLNTLSSSPGLPPTAGPIMQYAGYGIVLVVTLVLMPRGIVPTVESAVQRSRARRGLASAGRA
jgi:branched-chain amino acid transport system permease protein